MTEPDKEALDYQPEQKLEDVVGDEVDDDLTADIDFNSLDSSLEEGEA